jgi:hypothetical protein
MKKALLRRKRRKPDRIKKKVTPFSFSRKESEKKGKYTRSKTKQEEVSILRDEFQPVS